MSGTFYHDLHILFPCAFCQFAQSHQLLDLTDIACVRQTAGATGISEGNRHIIRTTNFQYLIIILIKRILFTGHTHPSKNQRAASGYDIHLPFMLLYLFQCFSRNPTMQRHKIDAVFCVETNDIDKILCRQGCKVSLIMNHTIIYRNRSDHRRTFGGQFFSKRLRVSM